jgi:transcriptional regulator with XRE-family HTH domain
MYSKELIELYMNCKNYTQQKQMAADLKISSSYLSDINNGRREFTDTAGIYIAIECGLDPAEVVSKLAEARAKTTQEKSVWADVVKKYRASAVTSAGAALSAILTLPTPDFLTSLNHLLR